jgi:hypothetical protein
MGKYSSYSRPHPHQPRNQGVHPIMRGIGCIMMVVVPILAYFTSMLVVDYGYKRGWPIPPEWFGPPTIPELLWKLTGLTPVLYWLQARVNLEAYLFFTAVITGIVGIFLVLLYGYIYTLFGPPRYGPLDAPPIKGRKIRPYKR